MRRILFDRIVVTACTSAVKLLVLYVVFRDWFTRKRMKVADV